MKINWNTVATGVMTAALGAAVSAFVAYQLKVRTAGLVDEPEPQEQAEWWEFWQ